MKMLSVMMVGLVATQLSMCTSNNTNAHSKGSAGTVSGQAKAGAKVKILTPATVLPKKGSGLAVATFAGGCFWCMQPPYDKLKGVVSTTVGYIGGVIKNPTYKQVAYGRTKHAEAIQVVYNPKVVTYKKLLHVFWRNHDPTTKDRSFFDRGRHYRSAVFYHNAAQKKLAEASKISLDKAKRFKNPIVTEISKAGTFYSAEKYHQKYYKKNPAHYYRYRIGSGRDRFIQKHWGKKK